MAVKTTPNIVKLDEGLTNLGFTLDEAIMESSDDSYDAMNSINEEITEINIHIFEETYTETINDTDVTSPRYSYIVVDNGPGTEVDGIFNFGHRNNNRFQNLNDLKTLNGIYHYGLISPLNVAKAVNFYSRIKNGQWFVNKLSFNTASGESKSCISKEDPPTYLIDQTEFEMGTFVYVQGISRSDLGAEDIESLKSKLLNQFGIIYRDYLFEGNIIKINGESVVPIDVFMQMDYYKSLNIQSKEIGKFNGENFLFQLP